MDQQHSTTCPCVTCRILRHHRVIDEKQKEKIRVLDELLAMVELAIAAAKAKPPQVPLGFFERHLSAINGFCLGAGITSLLYTYFIK